MKTAIQTAWETADGIHLVTHDLKPDLFLLSLYSTRHIIEMDIADCKDESVKVHLLDSFHGMSRAIATLEEAR